MKSKLIVLLALAAGIIGGCDVYDDDAIVYRSNPGAAFGGCPTSSPCGVGLTCDELDGGDICLPPCDSIRECERYQPSPIPVGSDLACDEGLGLCVVRCMNDADCPSPMICAKPGRCVWGSP